MSSHDHHYVPEGDEEAEERQEIEDEEANADAALAAEEDEADGIDLYADDELVPGQRELEREREVFLKEGIDPDEYDADLLASENEEEETEIDPKIRRAAERRMNMRDQAERNKDQTLRQQKKLLGGVVAKYLDAMLDEGDLENIEKRKKSRPQPEVSYQAPSGDLILEAKSILRFNDPATVAWDAHIAEAITTLFKVFLYSYSEFLSDRGSGDDGQLSEQRKAKLYVNKLREMQREEETGLTVSVRHLLSFHCDAFPEWIRFKPVKTLEAMAEVVTADCIRNRPDWYENRMCFVLISDWPSKTEIRQLRHADINTMVNTSGVVVKRSGVLPRLRELYLSCTSCGENLNERPFLIVPGIPFKPPGKCLICGRGVFKINRVQTLYQNFQKLTVQESPGSVPVGRAPRSIQVLLSGPLTDRAKPGEEIDILGCYKTAYDIGLNVKTGFPILSTHILANNTERKEDVRIGDMTSEDIKEIIELSKDKHIRERIIASIAPALWGQKQVKTSIAYAMFGGVPKGVNKTDLKGGHTIRGDINILLLGDPGLGKSQALQYIHRTFHRTVYTTGKGASAVGLTAGVKRDPMSGEWTLEGGALVLADEGMCLIDEFDKMTDKDRVSIHEAMEQQSISIAKAGIVTELKARCSVVAAANPKFGRYEPSLTFKENVDLSDPILSRFDLIAVLRDIPNYDSDLNLADYVLSSHMVNHPSARDNQNTHIAELEASMQGHLTYEAIPQTLLQKYIIYARNKCKPSLSKLQGAAYDRIAGFYSQIRQRASRSGGYSMTLRHVEGMIRIAEANARMRLSPFVTVQDADMAIATMLDSFVSSQKHAVATSLGREFARYRALARGGYEMLTEIVRRSMQERINRNRVRKGTYGTEAALKAGVQAEMVPLEQFEVIAKKNKFTDLNIKAWLTSKEFNVSFKLTKVNGEEFIASKTAATHSRQNK